MNWVGTLWPMISAASLTLALVYWLARVRGPARLSHLLIAVAAASVAAVGLLELAAMNTQHPADYARMVRWAHVPVATSAICVVGFVFHHYGVGSPLLAALAVATRAACLLPNFFSGANLNYSTIESIRPVLFLGARVSIPDVATPNPWMMLGSANALLVAMFIGHAIFQLSTRRRSPERTRAIATCTAILAFAAASGTWTWLVVHGRIDAPMLFAPMFLGVLLAMAYTLAGGFGSAGRLAHSLEFALGRRRAARRHMLQAMDAARVGFWSFDGDSGRVRLSHHACTLFGIPPQDALAGEALLARLPRRDRPLLAAAATRERGELHCEFRVRLGEGRHRWLAAHGRRAPGKTDRRLEGVLVDITDRKEAESRFRRVVEAASAPHLVVAPSGRVAFANRAAAGLFGHRLDALAGMDVRQLIRPEGDSGTTPGARQYGWLPSAAIGSSVAVSGLRKDGAALVPLVALFNPIPFQSDLFLLVSLRDLRGNYGGGEATLQHDDAAHLSRVSMVETLSGSLAHELNQPLAAILANAQAARRFLDGPVPDLDEVRASLAAIAESDVRAAEIIKRMRALLRKDTSEFAPFDVGAAIGEVAGMLRGDLLIREVDLQLDLHEPLPPAWGDPIQIQQVVLNLVMNACDAMRQRPPPRHVTVRATGEDDAIRVTVEDRGSGVGAGDLERIFEPFHTSKREGLGLGLSVCRTILLAHQGEIWAESEGAGRGAAVSFRLPTAQRLQAQQTDAAVAADATRARAPGQALPGQG